jgi:predicted dehydrogenase
MTAAEDNADAPTGIAIVGCGFVADYYISTLGGHEDLRLVGVIDSDLERMQRFAAHHAVPTFDSLARLLADKRVQIVVNLTNPRNHYDVTSAALSAGKHVYSEKPLAMDLERARELVALARRSGLELSSAPCSLLGETAQTLWKAVRDDRVGPVRVVYAEMDEGLVHRMPFGSWSSEAGAPWPYRDEFEVGTVIEHAGYVVTWLPAIFGPVTTVTGYADCVLPDKAGVANSGTDFSVAVLRFASGALARVTCSLIAPHDHSVRVVGDQGVLAVDDTWFYDSRVTLRRSVNIGRRHQWLPRRRLRLVGQPRRYRYRGTQQMDFARGVAELAAAIREGRSSRLSADYCLHVTEIVLALDTALRGSCRYEMTTTFEPIEPMPWAR